MIYVRKNSKNEDFVIFDPKMRQIRNFCRKISQNFALINQKSDNFRKC